MKAIDLIKAFQAKSMIQFIKGVCSVCSKILARTSACSSFRIAMKQSSVLLNFMIQNSMNIDDNQLMLKCTARSAWMHCKERKQKNHLL